MDENYKNKIYEIIEAANLSLKKLNLAKIDLKSASGWGVIDILGGGLISTLFKHKDMNDAEIHLKEAKSAIKNFSEELKQLDELYDIDVDTYTFLGFADLFFNGIISDWLMQSKIAQAQNQLDIAIKEVEKIKFKLLEKQQELTIENNCNEKKVK